MSPSYTTFKPRDGCGYEGVVWRRRENMEKTSRSAKPGEAEIHNKEHVGPPPSIHMTCGQVNSHPRPEYSGGTLPSHWPLAPGDEYRQEGVVWRWRVNRETTS